MSRLYDYTNSREQSHQGQLFFGNKTSKLSAEELRKEFESDANAQLRTAFGSFDNYLAYMDERQDLIDSGSLKADWWDTGDPLFDPETGYEVINEGDPNVDYKEQMMTLSAGGYNSQAAMHELYTKYTGQDITEARTNENGDNYRWNGTSYVKTFTNDGGFAKDLTIALMTAAIGSAASPLLASKLGATGLGAGASKGIAAGAVNAGTQLATTGEIDPRQVLSAGVVGGLNPGEKLAGLFGDAIGMSATGQPFNPDSFGYGAISGAGNAAVSQLINTGNLDAGGLLKAGLISGGINSIRDAFDDADYYTQEKIADRLVAQGYSPEEAWVLAGSDSNLFKGKSDLGALVGEGGLFSFLPEVPVGGLGKLANALSGGESTFFRYPKEAGIDTNNDGTADVVVPAGTEIPFGLMDDESISRAKVANALEVTQNTTGLLNNPIVNTAGSVLGQILGTPTMSDEDKAIYDNYRATAEINAQLDPNWDKLGAVGKEALVTEIQQDLYKGYLASYHGSDGLDEKYTVAPNPRGDADIIGSALVGIDPETGDPLYTTGIRYRDQLANGGFINTALPILKLPEPSNGNVIMNLDNSDQGALPAANTSQDFLNFTLTDSILNGTFANDDTSNSGASNANTGSNQATVEETSDSTTETTPAPTPDPAPAPDPEPAPVDATVPDSNVTPLYGLPINDDGTATLPGGATVPANVADSIYEQSYLPTDYELAGGGTDTLPSGGGGGGGGGNGSGNKEGLPPLWSELFGYTKISPYKKARLNVLEGMLSGMLGGGVGNFNQFEFGSNKDPYQKIAKSLYEAGIKE